MRAAHYILAAAVAAATLGALRAAAEHRGQHRAAWLGGCGTASRPQGPLGGH